MKKIAGKYRYPLILLRELVKTDFKLRYQGSILGMLWSVLKPLMLFAVMYMVFVHFLRFGAGVPHFATSLLLAIALWSFFEEVTSRSMLTIVGNGDLLRKINFPKYIMVISTAINALINFVITVVIVIIMAAVDGVSFHWHILLIPLVLIQLFVLAMGVSFLLATLYVKFRDIAHIWEVLLRIAFYATPIIYPISMIANMANPMIAKAMVVFNPMAQIIQDARYLIVTPETETVWSLVHNFWVALIPIFITIVIAVLALIYFRKNSKNFAEII